MTNEVKSAKELLKKFKSKNAHNSKQSLSISIDKELFEKLTYLSNETKLSKNEIVNNALLSFGLNDIEISSNKELKN